MKKREGWSEMEIDMLFELYPLADRQQILAEIPRHSWASIRRKASELKVKRYRYVHREKNPGISPKIHHWQMIQKYFPASRPLKSRPGLDAPSLLRDLREGIVGKIKQINASRLAAKDLRR
jgi:hypothetical protein